MGDLKVQYWDEESGVWRDFDTGEVADQQGPPPRRNPDGTFVFEGFYCTTPWDNITLPLPRPRRRYWRLFRGSARQVW